mgnify:CR=1 FL=1
MRVRLEELHSQFERMSGAGDAECRPRLRSPPAAGAWEGPPVARARPARGAKPRVEPLPAWSGRVDVPEDPEAGAIVRAQLCGRMRKYRIRVILGDRVTVLGAIERRLA